MSNLFPSLWAASGSAGGADLLQFLPLVLVFVLMYFFFIRPQQKKEAQQKELLASLKVGDMVLMQAGLIGKVLRLTSEHEILLTMAPDVDVRVLKSSVVKVLDEKEPRQVRVAQKEKAIEKKSRPVKKKSS
ncbi:preprotein translocase subunit YajC [bacterium NHP-B]|nr:preprotein translocase subunit YajC [bacterium NHP-B]